MVDRTSRCAGGGQHLSEGGAFDPLGGEEPDGTLHHPGPDPARGDRLTRLGPALTAHAKVSSHAVTKRLLRHALDHGSRPADRYLLDVAPDLLESRDMQYAVDLLLTQGARKFIQNHAEVIFEGR